MITSYSILYIICPNRKEDIKLKLRNFDSMLSLIFYEVYSTDWLKQIITFAEFIVLETIILLGHF